MGGVRLGGQRCLHQMGHAEPHARREASKHEGTGRGLGPLVRLGRNEEQKPVQGDVAQGDRTGRCFRQDPEAVHRREGRGCRPHHEGGIGAEARGIRERIDGNADRVAVDPFRRDRDGKGRSRRLQIGYPAEPPERRGADQLDGVEVRGGRLEGERC